MSWSSFICRGVYTCCQGTVFISWSEQYQETKMIINIFFSFFFFFVISCENGNAVTCKFRRLPAVLQVFSNFSWLSLNLDGSYVCESVNHTYINVACEYCDKKFSAVKISSIEHFIRWWKIWKNCPAFFFYSSFCIV